MFVWNHFRSNRENEGPVISGRFCNQHVLIAAMEHDERSYRMARKSQVFTAMALHGDYNANVSVSVVF